MGWVRGCHPSPSGCSEEVLRISSSKSVTYVTAVMLVAVLLLLGGRHKPARSYEQIRLRAHGHGCCSARACGGREAGNAATDGAKLQMPARRDETLAFGAVARRGSSAMGSGWLRRAHDEL